ncbi:MFS general substrate transporter [Pyrenochaeta sp. DS3sAY3a]|nr:MFS general substrate transporter [Pyrenochaeta sp. DS3sAY3a]
MATTGETSLEKAINHVDSNVQSGIQKIEATAVVWTRNTMVIAYILVWLIYFIESLLTNTSGALVPYVTSAFALHSLTPTVSVLSSVIGGVISLPIAKILDVFGRPQGLITCLVIAVVGLIMMAACDGVEAYAAAQVFFTVGNTGVQYILSVLVADTTSLRNRGLMQALTSSPNLITIWIGGPMATAFLNGAGWRWNYGVFTILVPVIVLPLYGLLLRNYTKAKKEGLIEPRPNRGGPWQSVIYYCREFDALGLLLLSAGVALFLLPFNLYTMQAKQWSSPLVISMLVVGIILIVSFVVWEKFFAPVTFIPYSLLLNRNVFGACMLSFTLFLSYFCWAAYFSSFLQVVNGLSVTHASYVVQTYTVCSLLTAIAIGTLIHYTGRFKPVSLYFAIPLMVLGMGLMIYFRTPNGNIGYIVMCQIFISVASGTIIITDQIAILAVVSHQHIAVCLAILGLFGNIGGAIGLTIASALWQDIVPKSLMLYLPAEALENFLFIYADITTQLSYPVGSETRLAIQRAYGDAQKMLMIVGTAVWVVGFVAVLLWRDINVIGIKQTKGRVF